MKKKDLREILKQEIESEASALERRVNTQKSLTSLEMPENSYDELMERIRTRKEPERKPVTRFIPFPIRRKALATVAMVAVLVAGAGLGVHGARLYILNVNSREKKERVDITADTEDIFYVELTEEEAYEKIEEEIGVLALRLGYKPNGMELEEVIINAEMGEALVEFGYNTHVLNIYENKQNKNASFNAQLDGAMVDKIETFYLQKELEILEIDKKDGNTFYWAQLEHGNAYYQLSTDIELEEFENILYGLLFKNE